MKYTRIIMLGLGVFIGISIFTTVCFAEGEIITTLLAKSTQGSGQLRISADGSDPIKSTATARLSFELSPIPKSATIRKVTLRLVGHPAKSPANPQLVNIFPDGANKSVGSWTATRDRSVSLVSTQALLQQVDQALKANKELSLTFSSRSRLSDWQYYSMAEYGQISSNKPRLIIEYEFAEATIARQQERDTSKTRWKYFPQPNSVTVKPFLDKVTAIISNPVFYDGGIYLFAQPSSQKTMLYALHPGGGNRWGPKEIQVRPGPHALVTSAGRLYSVGEDRLVLYDLEKEGTPIKSVDISDFKPVLRPTLGADGSLYAMPSGSGYLYGFNPDPQELWRYRSDNTKLGEASRVTVSPDAGRYAYVLTKVGNETHPVRIDAATGSAENYNLNVKIKSDGKETDKNLDLGFKGFHRPVAIKGPQNDYVFLSAYTEQNGMLLAHSGGDVIWWQEGPVSQPIVDWGEERVLAVQSGGFRGYDKFNGKQICTSSETDITVTSNLVTDGEDNVYFWNNGTLLGYTKDCKNFLKFPITVEPKLPTDLELMFAPDGTLFARAGNFLYSMTPSQKTLTVAQAQLQTNTIYSADTIQVAANLHVKNENIILKAEKNISFGKGMSVQKGASVRCRIGF